MSQSPGENPSAPEASVREAARESRRGLHRAWLQLVRAPNLLTAIGDPVAGACLAAAGHCSLTPGRVIIAAISSVAVYAAGLVDNDLVDLAQDGDERSSRPLPSGAVPLKQASKGRLLLFLVPFCFAGAYRMPVAWLVAHALLVASCLAYNRLKARSAVLGAFLMGLCRALSLGSGMALVYGEVPNLGLWPLSATIPWLAFVGGICLFAERETTHVPGPGRHALVLAPLLLVAAAFLPAIPPDAMLAMLLAGACGTILVLDVTLRFGPTADPRAVPPSVGRLVRALVPMQALLCLAIPRGFAPCALLLLCWALAERVSRKFYAS